MPNSSEIKPCTAPQAGALATDSASYLAIRLTAFIRLRQNTLQLAAGMNGEATAP